jgi:hypothetical protein
MEPFGLKDRFFDRIVHLDESQENLANMIKGEFQQYSFFTITSVAQVRHILNSQSTVQSYSCCSRCLHRSFGYNTTKNFSQSRFSRDANYVWSFRQVSTAMFAEK